MSILAAAKIPSSAAGVPEVSIVLPCLNEAETLASVLRQIQAAGESSGLAIEVIVADNGSTDGSLEIAAELGARVVEVQARGYGSALRGGIEVARGRFVIMGDADDSYDFSGIGLFVDKLRDGYDLVMGNRFQGGIQPGAMPWKNRWIGNPILSTVGRLFFRPGIGDFHCGLRAFSKAAYERLDLQTTGMEFASEMVVRASVLRLRVGEVPTVLRPDGRSRSSHLRPWRDGWRHLRFLLLYSPSWLFLLPGLVMLSIGLLGSVLLTLGPRRVGSVVFDINTLLVMALLVIIGFQVIVFAVSTRIFAIRAGLLPESPTLDRLYRYVTLETGLLAGAVLLVLGLAGLGIAVAGWSSVGFERLDPRVTMRELIPATVAMAVGAQAIFASFFLSFLGMGRSDRVRAVEPGPRPPR